MRVTISRAVLTPAQLGNYMPQIVSRWPMKADIDFDTIF